MALPAWLLTAVGRATAGRGACAHRSWGGRPTAGRQQGECGVWVGVEAGDTGVWAGRRCGEGGEEERVRGGATAGE